MIREWQLEKKDVKTAAAAMIFSCGACVGKIMSVPDVSILEKELALGQKALQKHDENAAAKLILQNQFGIRQALSKIKKEKKTKFPTETPKKGEFCGLSRPQILSESYLETGDISRESFREFLSAYAENKNLMAHEFALLPCFLRLAGLKLLLEIMRKIACPEKETSEKERILLAIRQENCVKTVFSVFALADELKNDLLWQCSKTAQLLMHDPSFMQLDPEQRLSLIFKLSEIAAKFGVKEYFAAQKLIELSRGSDVFSYVFGEKRDELIKSFGKKPKAYAKREAYFFFTWILPLAVAVLNGNFWLIFPVFVLLRALANSLFPVFCHAEKRMLPVLAEMPENERTLITISAMLKGNAAELAQKLQLRYLANKHEEIAAALLLDFAGKEDEKEAEKLFSIIAEMNAAENGHPYYAFIRKKMPAKDGSSCAWERKRGAILELCALTLGKETKSEFLYSALPEGVKRLILLDEDTEPMPGSLEKLIRCAAHPLNRPVVENGKLICGRVLISPSIGTHLLSANHSFFTKMFGRNAGVDRYSQQRSELLFDLFGKTDFCGKGIVDIEAFYALFWGKFPEERILSHDHIEGLIGNAGYFSGTAMFEGLPKDLISFEKRGHRWLRGDIQQLPFLSAFPFAEKLRLISCMLGGFEKPAVMVLLLAVLSREIHPILFIVLVFGKSLLPLIAALKNRETEEARLIFSEAVFSFAVLPYTAMMANDAIMRSLYRLFISKKKLLEWTTAKDSEKTLSAVSYYGEMWPNLLMAVICLFTVPILAPIFAFAPLLGYFSAKERKEKQSDPEWIRQAYPIWRFFLENRLENGFLPDNIQISPKRSPAMRTSPTNAAYCLLAPLIAAKLGFVPWEWAKAETEKLIATLEHMEKWHGHLYNWYALPDMQVLQPAFISSVDSGNLACACIAAAEMLGENAPQFSAENLITALSIKDPYLKKLARGIASADEKERLRSFAIISIYTEKKRKDDENIRLFGEDIKRFFIAERMQTDGKALAKRLYALFSAMDFSALYSKKKKLLSIGYDVEKGMLSGSYYDLFSSEAKQSYYAAIIKGDIPPEAWFALDRSLIRVKNGFAAASWSGTMFEFLMPALLLPAYEGSFARENIENAAYEQLANSPGISESGYYAFDRSLSYQYKAFGLKKLAYRNEPDDELVYAPYAAMLALPYHEKAVEKALGFYRDMAMQGKYGFFEAIDMRKNKPRRVMSYMVHHMGMSLSAIYHYLTGGELQKSLMKNPNAAAFSLLLMEKRPPRNIKTDEIGEKTLKTERKQMEELRDHGTLLSNGELLLLAKKDGSFFGTYKGKMLFRESPKLRLLLNGKEQPLKLKEAKLYAGSAEYLYAAGAAELSVKMAVSPEKNLILMRAEISGTDEKYRLTLECIPSLDTAENIASHPTFSELFLETKFAADQRFIYARRRPKDENESLCLGVFCSETAEMGIDRKEKEYQNKLGAAGSPMLGLKIPVSDEAIEIAFAIGKSEEELRTMFSENSEEIFQIAEAFSEQTDSAFGRRKAALFADIASFMTGNHAQFIGGECEPLPAIYRFGISGRRPFLLVLEEDTGAFDTLGFARFAAKKGFLCDIFAVKMGSDLPYRKEENIGIIGEKQLSEKLLMTLKTAASLVICGCENIRRNLRGGKKENTERPENLFLQAPKMPDAELQNGIGGFTKGGSEYALVYQKGSLPGVYAHVLANEECGCTLTAAGWSNFWHENARLFRITPYLPDPVREKAVETLALKILGEEKICYLLPNEDSADEYLVRFGNGYASFETEGRFSLKTEIRLFGSEKRTTVKIKNHGKKAALMLFYRAKLQLGENPDEPKKGIVFAEEKGRLSARNRLTMPEKEVYFYASEKIASYTTDGFEADSFAKSYSGSLASNTEPCFAVQIPIDLAKGEEKEICLSLGCEDKNSLPKDAPKDASLRIRTPMRELDIMVNHWLPYQTKTSRILAKSAYYQSGGAVGFRDQLQDSLMFLYNDPEFVRRQLLYFAERQFAEGDVLHWWHFESTGVRTHISDDLLFLPYAALQYVKTTEDLSILEENCRYLQSEAIENGKDLYRRFAFSEKREAFLMHLVRAIDHASKLGQHGLPLMKGGDWNDSMDKVGEKGKGESVFLAFFLAQIKREIAPYLKQYHMEEKAAEYLAESAKLMADAERFAWDGEWYLRAYFDNGNKLGTAEAKECRIDLLSQAWAVLSGAEKGKTAMASAYRRLFLEKEKIFLLLDPPFEKTEAGYIRGYLPGVRENGAQYTHAAAWGLMALCRLGLKKEAEKVLRALLPASHTKTREDAMRYRAEPYALAADVYAHPAAIGQAGWTWYTGSAAVLYNAVVQEFLGIKICGNRLSVLPKVPENWEVFSFRYIFRKTEYHINMKRGEKIRSIELKDDGKTHELTLGF